MIYLLLLMPYRNRGCSLLSCIFEGGGAYFVLEGTARILVRMCFLLVVLLAGVA